MWNDIETQQDKQKEKFDDFGLMHVMFFVPRKWINPNHWSGIIWFEAASKSQAEIYFKNTGLSRTQAFWQQSLQSWVTLYIIFFPLFSFTLTMNSSVCKMRRQHSEVKWKYYISPRKIHTFSDRTKSSSIKSRDYQCFHPFIVHCFLSILLARK